MNVLWFKRDLRLSDHAPLAHCANAGPFVALYVYEPEIMASPEYGANQHAFINDCLDDLGQRMAALGGRLHRVHASICDALDALHQIEPIEGLYSHMETGNDLTFQRDKAVKRWCRARGVRWTEVPTVEVCRPHPSRDGWSRRWHTQVRKRPAPSPTALTAVALPTLPSAVETLTCEEAGLGLPAARVQAGGRARAEELLQRFIRERTGRYPRMMSAPGPAAEACSRLSPHLAVGSISSREVIHKLDAARRLVTDKAMRAAYDAFESRLAWRGHFMQRLEDDTSIETVCLHPAMDAARKPDVRFNGVRLSAAVMDTRYAAWCAGTTGFPMVDACIRSLRATGWLNFRMRAMIVSVACYTLWLDWRRINPWLARQFTDYEPGIHLNQLQMQSGSTGINELRIYNPVRQAAQHDPDGAFIREWVPELRALPTDALHSLGDPGAAHLLAKHNAAYPEPIVNHQAANRAARQFITRFRQTPEARAAAADVNRRLGSRKPRPPRRRR